MDLEELKHLPGAEFVLEGIEDLRQNKETENSLLVKIGATRLRSAGLAIPSGGTDCELPEHLLYRWLAKEYQNEAHSRYNAMIRRLVSFERALEAIKL